MEIVLDRPPVNAITLGMFHDLRRHFSGAHRSGARGIVLTSRGGHFSAGADLKELGEATTPAAVSSQQEVIREAYWSILRCSVPVVCALRGAAVGAGAALAAVSDVIIATPDARLVMPEISVGIVGGSSHLQRILPHQLVRWMSLSGEPVSGQRLRELGAVLDIVDVERLDQRATEVCKTLMQHSSTALAYTKCALNEVGSLGLEDGYRFEQRLSNELARHSTGGHEAELDESFAAGLRNPAP